MFELPSLSEYAHSRTRILRVHACSPTASHGISILRVLYLVTERKKKNMLLDKVEGV